MLPPPLPSRRERLAAGHRAKAVRGVERRFPLPQPAAAKAAPRAPRGAGRRGAARGGARRHSDAVRQPRAGPPRPAPPRPSLAGRARPWRWAGAVTQRRGGAGLGALGRAARFAGGRRKVFRGRLRLAAARRSAGGGEPGDTGRATRGRTGAGARSPASGIPSAGAAWSLMAGHATRGAGESSRIRSLGALLLPAGSPAKPVGRGAVQAPRGASGTAAGSRRGPRVPLPEAPAGAALLRAAHPPRPAEGPRSRRAPRSPRPPRRAAWASAGLPGGRDQEELPAAGYVRVPPVSSA